MKLLDLFSGAGGSAVGYHRAGFEVVGVDHKPQKHYPFEFHCADAFAFLEQHGHEFDVIHASPPCQAYSQATLGTGQVYPDLLPETRARLLTTGKPWIIENVPGAPMDAHYEMCGCQFGLPLRRKRYFETNFNGFAMSAPCKHDGPVVSIVGHGTPTWVRKRLGFNPTIKHYREAMGIDWMNRNELSQAIPPAYTEFIGRQLNEAMKRAQGIAP
jgi:DNA (cytosine-5)-methyltransferase 1